MACKTEERKKCASKPPTKDGNPWVASWNESRKKCVCMINKQIKDDKGKVVDTELIDPAHTR